MPSCTLIKQESLDHQASVCLLSFLVLSLSSALFMSFLIACFHTYGLQKMLFIEHTCFCILGSQAMSQTRWESCAECLASPGLCFLMDSRYSLGALQCSPGTQHPEAAAGPMVQRQNQQHAHAPDARCKFGVLRPPALLTNRLQIP